jgi:exodeoxyribonuclease III
MKIVSWNINGIRSNIICEGTIKKKFIYDELIDSNLKELIDKHDPDIICFQETKCSEEIGSIILPNDKLYPFKYWNESKGEGRRGSGYSGTSVWCKKEPTFVTNELEDFKNDSGRFIYLEYDEFSLINMYVPNSGGNIELRKDYWDIKLKKLMDSKIDKPFILTGDFNVVHERIDIWNPNTLSQGNVAGLLPHERFMFNQYLVNYSDVYRELNPGKKEYTWWNTITRSRASNKGWRIDYFLIQKKFLNLISMCTIDNAIMGSDHCPILLSLNYN